MLALGAGTLDDVVRTLIRDHDAQPLMGNKTTLRFGTEMTARFGAGTIVSQSAVHLTPVPGSHRRRGLVLGTGLGRPVDVAPDSDSMNATRFLVDAVVSSLIWRQSEGRRA